MNCTRCRIVAFRGSPRRACCGCQWVWRALHRTHGNDGKKRHHQNGRDRTHDADTQTRDAGGATLDGQDAEHGVGPVPEGTMRVEGTLVSGVQHNIFQLWGKSIKSCVERRTICDTGRPLVVRRQMFSRSPRSRCGRECYGGELETGATNTLIAHAILGTRCFPLDRSPVGHSKRSSGISPGAAPAWIATQRH
ncbi:hypothetical protein TBK1r_62800 [Stieleria magnilauensis]|uniref:Uncharacterized protein n=1 Tax=Stieleria magnilauensis TaxID=2527963 RepID=A0ABX5XZP2_9BACT|nr:hypothetical protein TBK1r_62800 [Planctomycetes bacterium TBK1r]